MNWHDPDLTRELATLIDHYVSCSATMDFAGKRALWDKDDPHVLLMPEEDRTPHIGWEAINPYWKDWSAVMEYIRSAAANHAARRFAPDLALCFYDMRWIAKLHTAKKPVSGDVRVTSWWRQKPEGWRLFQLIESPLDGAARMRLAEERAAIAVFGTPPV